MKYGPHSEQKFELFLPKAKRPPVVLMIHGGFWKSQYDSQQLRPLALALNKCGFATILAEYRCIGNEGFGWPGTFEDMVTILAEMPQLAEMHDLDLKRIVALGHSAGGHLAMWLGACQTHPDLKRFKCPVILRGVLSLAPICDLEKAFELSLGKGVVAQFLEGTPENKPERYRLASPSRLLPSRIRQIVIHGVDDEGVPISMSESYVEQAKRAGDPCKLLSLPHTGHMDLINPEKECFNVLKNSLSDLLPS